MKDGGMEAYINYFESKKEENREIFIQDVIMNKWEDIMADNIVFYMNNAAKKKIVKKLFFYINAKHSKLLKDQVFPISINKDSFKK